MRHRRRLVSEEAASDQRMPGASSVVSARRQADAVRRAAICARVCRWQGVDCDRRCERLRPAPCRHSAPEDGKIPACISGRRCLGEQFCWRISTRSILISRCHHIPDPENSDECSPTYRASPDVFSGCCEMLPIWAEEGIAQHIPYGGGPGRRYDQIGARQYASFLTPTGCGLPCPNTGAGAYYNKELFDEYGVAYPDNTWITIRTWRRCGG